MDGVLQGSKTIKKEKEKEALDLVLWITSCKDAGIIKIRKTIFGQDTIHKKCMDA
ncbi:MAG: hypothetical protein QS721_12975 [Candidatus Endonucleobacter sp. (ex Gigantidas childressi)]|nr:hypothetical protein [Candidatus Endonucleobacter sp. (ex Gigantidas childressi)]